MKRVSPKIVFMPKKSTTIYLCEQCGNEFPVWSGKCPMCGEWNSLKEVSFQQSASSAKSKRESRNMEAKRIDEIEIRDNFRLKTGIEEFDRVLGGHSTSSGYSSGIVPGSVILLGGEPGIGKSTLLLQAAGAVANTYYLSAEESADQIKIRASRLKLDNSGMMLLSDGDIEAAEPIILKAKPALLVVDSIQTVYLNSYDATPGSLVQVRECGMFLQQLAKRSGIPIILVGHVTKEGNLAGPRMLEHLVDVVLYLEGERFSDARILRGVKNRFGATDEIGVFSMQESGMVEVKNPSALFLSKHEPSPGSVVTVTLEGSRPILAEIQALVAPTNFGYPKRTSSGFDLNRLNLLAAVISKKTPFNLLNSDIYLNVVGGLKIKEPAADLAVCAAIISSHKNQSFGKNSCFYGEVGLLGEVRKVTRENLRKKEAETLGYELIQNITNLKDLSSLLNR